MAEVITGQVRSFGRVGGKPRARGSLGSAAALALGLLSACFSPEAYTEHLCRTCTSECPEGLTCHGNRCVPVCDSSCTGDYHCDGDACVPVQGEQCPERALSLALCVGQANDVVAAAEAGVSAEAPWVVLDSRLPEGVSFDPSTGRLSGSPQRIEPGSITLRHGAPGSEEVSVTVATQFCPQIQTRKIDWCRGTDETTRLVATRPGEYEWGVSSGPPGVVVQGDGLAGNLDAEGTYFVDVELRASGSVVDRQTLELSVVECGDGVPGDVAPPPLEITTLAALPSACEGVAYAAKFEATGGEPEYRWTLDTALDGLVLDEASGTLTGAPLASGDFELTVSVEDAAGNHDSIAAPLHVVSAAEECVTGPSTPSEEEACALGQSATCPRTPLRIATTDLGVACAGEAFSARLEASGGGGDYDWHLSDPELHPAPSGLYLERTGELHGVPTAAPGEYRVSVWVGSTLTDTPVYGSATLEIVSCDALVFLTDEPGADRLFHTSPGSGVVNELSDGLLGTGDGVHSFALSADGVHLAFDITRENAATRLYWADLTTFDVRQPAFAPALPADASLIDYRWSLDGSRIAATFRDGDDRVFLAVSPAAGGRGSSIELTGRYRSGLFWAAERICYVAPGLASPFVSVLCHSVTPEGIDDQAPASILDPSIFRTDLLLGSDEGYLAIRSDGLGARYFIPADQSSSADHLGRVFSPGFHFAAAPSPQQPTLGEVWTSRSSPDLQLPVVLAPLDPCEKIDAWSLDERSIACRSGDSLAIHRLETNGALSGGGIVQGSAGYPEEEFRRLWAPGGQWYAYDANGELRVVPVDATLPRSRAIFEGGAQTAYAGLGTDASGAHLYYHHGSDLEAIDTQADFLVRNVNGDVLLPDPAPCNEAQLDDGPRLWCGARATPSFFFPAPAAARVAFVDRQNQLYVADFAAAGGTFVAPRLVSPSSVKCTMDSGETACDNFVQWVPRRNRE